MAFVYHLYPRYMVGNTLQPLNKLKLQYPELSENYNSKYHNREALTTRLIPILNCLWNDVVFFSAVHPQAIKSGYLAIGKPWKPQKWLAVNVLQADFNAENTVIYYSDATKSKGDFSLLSEQIKLFNPLTFESLHELPAETVTYYRQAAASNEPIFAWNGLPHVLHCGDVSIAQAEIFYL